LRDVFVEMDRLKIPYQNEEEGITPCALVDGHGSRTGYDFVSYVNGFDGIDVDNADLSQIKALWIVGFGKSYGTSYWQPHDNQALNGSFKSELYKQKELLIQKKQAHGLVGEIDKRGVTLIVGRATQNSFAKTSLGKSAVAATGWLPPTMAPLDDPEILQSAPEHTQKERSDLLAKRGNPITAIHSNALGMPSRRDLLAQGSGLMAGGQAVSEAAESLNYNSATAAGLFQMADTM
jgi:hypothetical protein